MSDLGRTGKWLFVPVTVCVGLVGAYLVFNAVPNVVGTLLDPPFILRPHGVASIFVAEPSPNFLMEVMTGIPGIIDIPPVEWMGTLNLWQDILQALAGIWSILAMLCPTKALAKLLYYLSLAYLGVWIAVHAGILYCHRNRYLLDFAADYRSRLINQDFSLFGQTDWPESFWYAYTFHAFRTVLTSWYVVDLYYSWHLILKVGGSGWENLPAHELPGWESYQMKLREERKAKGKAVYDDEGDEEDEDKEEQQPQIGGLDTANLIKLLGGGGEQQKRREEDDSSPLHEGIPIMSPGAMLTPAAPPM